MRRFLIPAAIVSTLLLAMGVWSYLNRQKLALELACYRVGNAASYEAACRELAWFDAEPGAQRKRYELVSRWGTGHPRFDEYVAGYLFDPRASEQLRQAFSLEFSWRPELVPRWADYWRRQEEDPAKEIEQIGAYLQTLSAADPPRSLTWREVLEVQAVFALTGHEHLAQRLTPDNWPRRYMKWQTAQETHELP